MGLPYQMINRLCEMSTAIINMVEVGNRNLHLNKAGWEQAHNLRDLIKKGFIMTKSLQFEDYSVALDISTRSGQA